MTIVLAAILARLIRFERRREAVRVDLLREMADEAANHSDVDRSDVHLPAEGRRGFDRPEIDLPAVEAPDFRLRDTARCRTGARVSRSVRGTPSRVRPGPGARRLLRPSPCSSSPVFLDCADHSAVWRTTVGCPDGNHCRIAAADASSSRASLAETDPGGRCADNHRTRAESARRCGAVENCRDGHAL